ncbi:hypothetical protein GGX14DRAFT_554470 [Mycena pura]|uniref:Uncharacterized protein n=1 Tax=Mycena pura TaxID=153505 RepID=A0AAD6YSS9_9AGAR|nr:hypothetical protein GGX14DRAFT_554470 [Mycena pura]
MNPAPDTLRRVLHPFRPRQRRYEPPVPNTRAADFHAIRSQLPALTSRAACARYRLGRKTAITHRTLTRQLDCVRKQLETLEKHLLHILDTRTLLSPVALTSVIHDVECASSLCRSLNAATFPHTIPRDLSSLSTLLHGLLRPATSPRVPSSTVVDFFGG